MPAVFGFKDNGNGIVDKEDFSDAAMLKSAEEKGLIGKKWSEALGNLQVGDKSSNLGKTQGENEPNNTKTLFKRLGFVRDRSDRDYKGEIAIDGVVAILLSKLPFFYD